MDNAQYLDIVRADGEALIEVALANLDQDIAFLPGWTERDLVAHMGAVWSMANANVQAATTESTAPGAIAQAPDGAAIGDWIRERLATVLATLTDADPAATAWTFGIDQTAAFWIRRMAHEVSVHRWDAQAAVGTRDPIDGDLGTDGIDEYAEVSLRSSARRPNRIYPAESLHLHRTDGPGEWMFARGETEHDVVVTHEHGKGDAAVRGPGGDLSLWVRGRPVEGLEIFGDESVAAAWQELSP